MPVVETRRGQSPLVLGFPHVGTDVPSHVWDRLNENGRKLADTDWHVHTLYDGLVDDVTTVRATFHRYVIDANRDPSDASLYPDQNTTGLIPRTDFDGRAIWTEGGEPKDADIAERLARFHRPYHEALAAEVDRVKAIHGIVILYDCHSIRSHIPFLFGGRLPDLNIGTNDSKSCDPAIEAAMVQVAREANGYSSVLNGRFKGGWTTRRYGRPHEGVHAIQLELAQATYLAAEVSPFAYDDVRAQRLRVHLKSILERLLTVALDLKR